jgi:hypothetical protein
MTAVCAHPTARIDVNRTLQIAAVIVTVARVGQSTTMVSTSESMRINDPAPEAALCTEERAGGQSRRKFATLTWKNACLSARKR